MHHPVLLKEVIEGLNVKKDGLYIDATFGEAGHSQEILKRGGKILGIELDESQIQNLKNIKVVRGNFAEIEKIAKENKFHPVDGILFDLGLSMNQISLSGRGFSYKKPNEPLDMRISLLSTTTAADIVNSFPEDQLYEILAKYSEEINSGPIAHAVFRARTLSKIRTVSDMIRIINDSLGYKNTKVYARVFQALRIAVNNDLDNLKKGLTGAVKVLKRNGRIVVITFQSLEDRIVKIFIKQNRLVQLNKKIIKSGSDDNYERSAKLRIITTYENII